MAKIELKNVCKRYENGFEAVKDFQLEVEDKEFIIFVGPSGCGKSTTLRMIAGLEELTYGEILIDGVKMNHVSPSDRNIAMVFQNYALYPHMTVRKNIAYSLKIRHEKKEVIEKKVKEAAEILGLEEVLDRKPAQLSGGQKQRVAMGRAIVRNPKVFLMDEPLSNLDAKLRGQMRVEIARLYQRLDATFIYVTHDQTEAMTLGSRIVVMKDGIIQQVDTPQRLFHYPANQFVAGFIGTPPMNFVEGDVVALEGKVMIACPKANIELTEAKSRLVVEKGYLGKRVVVGIRPEHITIAKSSKVQEEIQTSHGEGKIDVYEILGSEAIVYLDTEHASGLQQKMIAKINFMDEFGVGDAISYVFDLGKIHLFDPVSGVTITN